MRKNTSCTRSSAAVRLLSIRQKKSNSGPWYRSNRIPSLLTSPSRTASITSSSLNVFSFPPRVTPIKAVRPNVKTRVDAKGYNKRFTPMDAIYRSAINRDVGPARPGAFMAVNIGSLRVWPPVVLAPMAGVTNYPFRAVCRRFGAGLYVSEMINARPLVDGRDKTLKLADFGPDESPRSMQLYGVDPYYVAEAVKRLVNEGRVDHLDMNFGCPVPKVTSKGGGSALPP